MAKCKMKSCKGLRKRVKLTAKGKLLKGHPGMGHILSKKSSKRKRKLRRRSIVAKGDAKKMKRLLGA